MEAFMKSLERFLTPQLNEIKGEIKVLNTKIEALDEKVDSIKNELKADIKHLDEKIDTKITALDEKVELMNKFNERLFNLIHPAVK